MSPDREPAGRPAASRRRVLRAVAPAAAVWLAGCGFQPFDVEGPVPAGRLFVENRTNFPKEIALSIAEGGRGGDPVIDQVYQFPEWHALQFDGVLEAGRTYDVRAYQPEARGSGQEQLLLTVETCGDEDAAGQMDVSILASSNGPDILTYGCDQPYAKTQSLTYVDPSAYATGRTPPTIPSPSPA